MSFSKLRTLMLTSNTRH